MSDGGYASPDGGYATPDEVLVGDGVDYGPSFITDEKFETRDEAVEHVKSIAILQHFEMVIASNHKNGRQCTMRCSRGLRYKPLADPSTRQRQRRTNKCGCPVKLRLKLRRYPDGSFWSIHTCSEAESMHNHPLAVYAEGYRQMSGLSPSSKAIVRDMTDAQAKPGPILAVVHKACPYDNAHITHIYNEREDLRRKAMEGRDVPSQMFYLAKKNNYTYSYQVDEGNVITHIFMAHPVAVKLLRMYYWWIGIDSTYKTNKYNMPLLEIVGTTPCQKNFLVAYVFLQNESSESYRWALQTLRGLFRKDKFPTAITSDRELGLLRPLEEVFPESQHMLCTWHINRDVVAHVVKKCKQTDNFAQSFKSGRWSKIIHAPSIEAYYYEVQCMKEVYAKNLSHIVRYLETTWLVHKEKFVDAWTNNLLHFGNKTTCRVEAAHASLKDWLYTSTGALDSLWSKVHKKLGAEHTQIRRTLEEVRRFRPIDELGAPLTYLNGQVTHYCIGLLGDERKLMKKMGRESNDLCDHVLRTTHGLPCACEMYQAFRSKTPIRVESVHVFWKSYVVEGDDDDQQVNPQSDYVSDDHRYVNSLVDDLGNMPPQVAAEVAWKMHGTMYPEKANLGEPEVKDTSKGRPRGSSSTARLKSWWDKTKKVGKDIGDGLSQGIGNSRGNGSGRGKPPPKPSTSKAPQTPRKCKVPITPRKCKVPITPRRGKAPQSLLGRGSPVGDTEQNENESHLGDSSTIDNASPSANASSSHLTTNTFHNVLTSVNIFDFGCLDDIPELIRPYVMGYLDVIGDGNCGFRVIADYAGKSEELWPQVRRIVVDEISRDIPYYGRYYYDGVASAISRIAWYEGPCGRSHWMQIVCDLRAVANAFNTTVILIQKQYSLCTTILPLRSPLTHIGVATQPMGEVCLTYLQSGEHFIRMHLSPNCPILAIHYWWARYHDASVDNWDRPYQSRIEQWQTLRGRVD
ncbi:hypothetical protein M5689_011005 [Euphorbia peplus]|nr:hypothetical protein M5689_011005 [Euphorbia peplus]